MLPLFKISLPANASEFFKTMMKIAMFDYIDTGPYVDSLLGQKSVLPDDPNLEILGFESIYFLNNLGTLALFYVVYVLVAILSSLAVCMLCCCENARYLVKNAQKKLFYGSLISLINESYMILVICCLVNL